MCGWICPNIDSVYANRKQLYDKYCNKEMAIPFSFSYEKMAHTCCSREMWDLDGITYYVRFILRRNTQSFWPLTNADVITPATCNQDSSVSVSLSGTPCVLVVVSETGRHLTFSLIIA